jgi:hypothetical protein
MQNADADRIRTRTSIFRVLLCPGDGTNAAAVGNEDFGASPLFWAALGKSLLAHIYLCRVSGAKRNGSSKN